jgi:hypothetical protein
MSINPIYGARGNAAAGVAGGAANLATSSFLQNNGGVVGGLLSIIWTALTVYVIKETMEMKETDKMFKNKIYVYIGAAIILLGTLINNAYYFKNKRAPKDKNSTYSNVALIPIYIIVLIVVMVLITTFTPVKI